MNTPENDFDELKEDLRIFSESIRADAERPEAFWANQRAGIAAKIQKPAPLSGLRPALLWAPAAIAILLCFLFFAEKSKAPTPDLAAGADQNLLVEVEQALDRNYPEALAPAALITWEIDQGSMSAGQSRPQGLSTGSAGISPAKLLESIAR
jgi:hypothetical protein